MFFNNTLYCYNDFKIQKKNIYRCISQLSIYFLIKSWLPVHSVIYIYISVFVNFWINDVSTIFKLKTTWFQASRLIYWLIDIYIFVFSKYTPIVNSVQRAEYKKDFNTHYNKYIQYHQKLDAVKARFTRLDNSLRGAQKGSQIYTVHNKNKKYKNIFSLK